MSKAWIIAGREYKTRVRKRSFILMTALGPIIMAVMMILPYWVTKDQKQLYKVLVVDETAQFDEAIRSTSGLQFDYMDSKVSVMKPLVDSLDYQAVLFISPNPNGFPHCELKYRSYNALAKQYMELALELRVQKIMLAETHEQVNVTDKDIYLQMLPVKSKEQGAAIREFFSYGGAVFIYFFIFLYGIQVMKAVIEEKNNRIVEVMLTTVKPIDLMIGKIVGLGFLGLTQMGIWSLFSVVVLFLFNSQYDLSHFDAAHVMNSAAQHDAPIVYEMHDLLAGLDSMNLPLFVIAFFIYFIGGYVLYAGLFAVVGAVSDVDTETQQFILPITIPLLFGFLTLNVVLQDPNGTWANVLSCIPLTAPITMLVRMPHHELIDGFSWRFALSVSCLIAGVVLVLRFAAKVYRVGILMYGKKAGYREIIKWYFYKG